MSNATGTEEAITVEHGGVSVTKSMLRGEFPVPTIAFELSTELEEPTIIRITESIPDQFSMDEIGFHSDYESDHWTAYEDNRIEFERIVAPDEKVVTLYGIRNEDTDGLDGFMADPEVVIVDPIEGPDPRPDGTPADQIVHQEDDEMLEELVDEPDLATDDDADVESVYEHEEQPGGAAPTGDGATLAAELADALRAGEVTDADRRALRDELGLDISASTQAQLRHLQARVEDAIAYADPITEFLDAGGLQRLDEIEEDVAASRRQLREQADEMDDAREEMAQLRSTIPDVESRVDEMGERLDSLSRSVDELRQELEEAGDDADRAMTVAADVEDEVAGLAETVDALDASIDDLDEDVEDMQAWRDQLGELFGGQG
ncbi:MAG: hypothetical protein ACOC42_04120 [Halobacteriota archaeon]